MATFNVASRRPQLAQASQPSQHWSLGNAARQVKPCMDARLPAARTAVLCAARTEDVQASRGPAPREAHKIFDEVTIKVRSGHGGSGEIVEEGKGKMVRNFKYRPGGSQPKQIWLSASEPCDGEAGADVVLIVDPSATSLLHLHNQKMFIGKKGANGDPEQGSQAPKRRERAVRKARPTKIAVPMGTVVKDKKGRLVAELVNVGDAYCICAGGGGGRGVVAPSREVKVKQQTKAERSLEKDGIETLDVEDVNWKEDTQGGPGSEATVTLTLRVVADVGLVGLPNVGKSSLLACMTRARPEVANYPFTTLMPNLGVMQAGGDVELRMGGTKAVLADLPGLIQGAHEGRGLGRMFLRHLARTSMMVHVIDAAAEDPAADYWVVREELRMYNPQYCARPHIVALNKMDLPDAEELEAELISDILAMAQTLQIENPDIHVPPVDLICCSAITNNGVPALMTAIAGQLTSQPDDDDLDDIVDWDTSLPETDDRFSSSARPAVPKKAGKARPSDIGDYQTATGDKGRDGAGAVDAAVDTAWRS